MIAQKTIQEIYEVTKIEEVIRDFIPLQKSGANLKGLCPFHKEKRSSFVVSPMKNIYKCFGCKKGGNAISFIMEKNKFSYPEAIRYLAKKYDIKVIEKKL